MSTPLPEDHNPATCQVCAVSLISANEYPSIGGSRAWDGEVDPGVSEEETGYEVAHGQLSKISDTRST